MRAIIIEDKDSWALLDKLKLESMDKTITGYGVELHEGWNSIPAYVRAAIVEKLHRKFHHVVCQWLQDQGADTVR